MIYRTMIYRFKYLALTIVCYGLLLLIGAESPWFPVPNLVGLILLAIMPLVLRGKT